MTLKAAREALRKKAEGRAAKIRDMHIEGRTPAEMAQELGITLRALHSARARLGLTRKRGRVPFHRSLSHARRALRLALATPKWVDQDQLLAIHKEVHERNRAGETVEADHIVPLAGKTVCGLNVPWNLQILPAKLNNWKRAQHHANMDLL